MYTLCLYERDREIPPITVVFLGQMVLVCLQYKTWAWGVIHGKGSKSTTCSTPYCKK